MSGKQIGYVRASTIDQNTERQLVGVELDKVFQDKASAKNTQRPQLESMLDYIREGDEVHVHDISRLARNIQDLHRLVNEITSKGCAVHFEKENLSFSADSQDPFSQLMLSMLGAVYQFERSIMLERQREGIAVAKAAGKFKGRPAKIDMEEIKRVVADGNSISRTAKMLGVSESTVQRAKRAAL
jgi:DNA invertase Pin-like site-specific DNA recombinase